MKDLDVEILTKILESPEIIHPYRSQNNSYLFNNSGHLIRKVEGCACFGQLCSMDGGADYFVATHKSLNYGKHYPLSVPQKAQYYHWLFFESQFSQYLNYNNVDWSLEKHGLLIRGDIPSNLVIFLAQCHRLSFGFTGIVRSWLYFSRFMDPKAAFYAAFFFPALYKDMNFTHKNLKYSPPYDEHIPLHNRETGRTNCKNFLAATVLTPNPQFRKSVYYRGIDSMWGEGPADMRSPTPRQRTDYGRPNPFRRPDVEVPFTNIVVRWAELNNLGDEFKWVE